MEKYKILEHTADLKIEVYGETKKELFSNALLAMTNGFRPRIRNKESGIRNIRIKSSDLEILLVDFLSEALYLIQTNREIYNKVDFKKFSDTELEAELFGQKVEKFDEDIKAVTYHDLNIRQKKDGFWTATILFDI